MKICRIHGGVAHTGRAPIHGRYAKTPNLNRLIEQVRAEEDLLDVSGNVAIFRCFKEELSARLDNNDSPDFRRELLDILFSEEEGEGPWEIVARARKHVQKGVRWDSTWRALVEAAEREGALQTAAISLSLKSENAVSPRQVLVTFQKFLAIVAQHCDTGQTRKITAACLALVGADPRIVEAGGGGPGGGSVQALPGVGREE